VQKDRTGTWEISCLALNGYATSRPQLKKAPDGRHRGMLAKIAGRQSRPRVGQLTLRSANG
jgi:hypothetical protein